MYVSKKLYIKLVGDNVSFMKCYRGHLVYSSTRKQPEKVFERDVNGTETFYIDAISEAVYLVVQVRNNSDNVTVECYQALSNDGTMDDTEPTYTMTIEPNDYTQKSDLVITFAPYLKVKITTSSTASVTIYRDYI